MRTKRSSTGLSIARTVTVPLPDGAALTVGYRFASENAARHRPLLDRLHRTGDRRIVERMALDLIHDWSITRNGRALPVNGKSWRALPVDVQDAMLAAIAEDSVIVVRAMRSMATVAERAR